MMTPNQQTVDTDNVSYVRKKTIFPSYPTAINPKPCREKTFKNERNFKRIEKSFLPNSNIEPEESFETWYQNYIEFALANEEKDLERRRAAAAKEGKSHD